MRRRGLRPASTRRSLLSCAQARGCSSPWDWRTESGVRNWGKGETEPAVARRLVRGRIRKTSRGRCVATLKSLRVCSSSCLTRGCGVCLPLCLLRVWW